MNSLLQNAEWEVTGVDWNEVGKTPEDDKVVSLRVLVGRAIWKPPALALCVAFEEEARVRDVKP